MTTYHVLRGVAEHPQASIKRLWQAEHRLEISNIKNLGAIITMAIVFSAGLYCAIARPVDNAHLYKFGSDDVYAKKYARALEPLERLVAREPRDVKALLSLSQAYLGVDEPVKAWRTLGKAKQLGAKMQDAPEVAAQFASYYTQHKNYKMAAELLKPFKNTSNVAILEQITGVENMRGDHEFTKGRVTHARLAWRESNKIKARIPDM